MVEHTLSMQEPLGSISSTWGGNVLKLAQKICLTHTFNKEQDYRPSEAWTAEKWLKLCL